MKIEKYNKLSYRYSVAAGVELPALLDDDPPPHDANVNARAAVATKRNVFFIQLGLILYVIIN